MNAPDLSRESYSDATALSAALDPAHSGPELASCVPDPMLAQELAQELLADHFELTRFNTYANTSHSSSGMNVGFTIGLARR